MGFVHLHVHSPFSFLDGASDIKKMVERAAELNMAALAITDHDNLSTAVNFHKAATKVGIKPIHGAEVTVANGKHLTLLCRGTEGYTNLCKMLTSAHLSNPRLHPVVSSDNLAKHYSGLIALSGCRNGEIASAILLGNYKGAKQISLKYKGIFGADSFFIEISEGLLPGSKLLNHRLVELARETGLKTVATNNAHYTYKHEFELHDILTCIRTLSRIDEAHPQRRLNAENYLKNENEMTEALEEYPGAIANSGAIAAECTPALVLGQKIFPEFTPPSGVSTKAFLRELVFAGANKRFARVTPSIEARLEHEMNIIIKLGYEDYFLLVWDLVQFAKRSGIRCSGRGSAADSAVAYCLYITDVDAIARGLLFERFLSLERAQKPDIDVDFDARYRDNVTRYVYDKYGRERVATVCTYNTFQGRSSVRDVGKAMGFSQDEIDTISKRIPYLAFDGVAAALQRFPELRESGLPLAKFDTLVRLCDSISGFPRHLGTHLGGVVISREPLLGLTPLQMAAKGITICQFDKDDVEDIGLVKLDLLSLRTLAAVEDSAKSIKLSDKGRAFDFDKIPLNDRDTYNMLNTGRTIGVFQLESPAQRALQARLGADNFEDIVASVALIRPGPIKGNMVEPFIARRNSLEPVQYFHPKLVPILKKTYGVILFQEQVIEIATNIAGFSPGESDRLRRVMTHARSRTEMDKIGEVFVDKSEANGVSRDVAEQIFQCMKGYASYGFCEAHAAAFANTAIKTAYLVRNYPAEFFAAILSNQPMGYYPPNTICIEARRRGIEVLRPCVNESEELFKPNGKAIRISLKQVKDISQSAVQAILEERKSRKFSSFHDFCVRVKPPKNILQNLIISGALDDFSPNRRSMLWEIDTNLALYIDSESSPQKRFEITSAFSVSEEIVDFTPEERMVHEYDVLSINVSCHPMAYVRKQLSRRGVTSSKELEHMKVGQLVSVAGYPVRPHRPPTKSGKIIVFMSLEDEFGLSDVTIFEDIYQKYGQLIFRDPCPALEIQGKIDKRGKGVSIVASIVRDLVLEG